MRIAGLAAGTGDLSETCLNAVVREVAATETEGAGTEIGHHTATAVAETGSAMHSALTVAASVATAATEAVTGRAFVQGAVAAGTRCIERAG